MKELKNILVLAQKGFLPNEKRTLRQTIILGVKLFVVLYAIKFSVGIFIAYLNIHGYIELPKRITHFHFENKFQELFIVAVYAPIYEELVFRVGLRFSKANFSVLVAGILYLFTLFGAQVERVYALLVSIIIGLFLYVFIREINLDSISQFWERNRLLIFYGLLSVFSLMHLNNYEFSNNLVKHAPILLFPHLIGGFIYSYARLNSGIFLAIILHSLNNGLPRVVSLLTD